MLPSLLTVQAEARLPSAATIAPPASFRAIASKLQRERI
jgi:hypothetical protein